MYCPNCGFKNDEGMRFCGSCGNELPATLPGKGPLKCANCGADLRPGIRFCGSCGTEAPATAASASASVPAPAIEKKAKEKRTKEEKTGEKKSGVKNYLVRFFAWVVAGVLVVVAWNLLQPQREALLTVYGRNPAAAEAAAQVFINENIPDLAYADRTVTFSSVEGIPIYVVDFFDNDAPISYGVRLLVDRRTLEVRLYQSANMTETQPTTTSPSDSAAQPSSGQFQLPAVASLLLDNPQLVASEDFITFSGEGWSRSDNVSVSGGMLVLPGSTPWLTSLRSPAVAEGRGVLIRFELADAPNGVEIFLASGTWDTDSYRRLGVGLYETGAFESAAWKGTRSRPDLLRGPTLEGSLDITTDTWYGLFVGADASGNLRVYVWDWENPTRYVWTSLHSGILWDDQTWEFVIQVDNGTMYLDDYGVVTFDGFK
jgi:hypothetical protein